MEKKIKSEIIKASHSVRKKLRLLKTGIEEENILSKKRYEPLLKPLETLIDLTGSKNEKGEELQQEMKREEEGVLEHPVRGKKRHRKQKRRIGTASSEESVRTISPNREGPSYQENIYEASGEEQGEGEEGEEWERWNRYLARFGKLTREYLDGFARDTKRHYDTTFGPRCAEDKMEWHLGNKIIHFDNEDFIHIGGEGEYNQGIMIPGRRGLFELLFKKMPAEDVVTEQDLKDYKYILNLTSAHMQNHNPGGKILSNAGYKYKKIIATLFPKKGGNLLPVTNNKIDYVHWNDPNELVERLALLIASEQAGNSGLGLEIASIEEELREGGYIV